MKKPKGAILGSILLLTALLTGVSPSQASNNINDCYQADGFATCLSSAEESENALFYNSTLPDPSPLRCLDKNSKAPRFQVLYISENISKELSLEITDMVNRGVGVSNTILKKSSNDEREFRFNTNEDCTPNIISLSLEKTINLEPNNLVEYLNKNKNKILNSNTTTPTNFLVYVSTTSEFCGQGTGLPLVQKNSKWVQDTTPSIGNGINKGSQVALIGLPCFKYPQVVAHELVHTLGAVSATSPNASLHGHCLDGHDLMCYSDAPSLTLSVKCQAIESIFILDCNGDDYFALKPTPDSYLATHWNTADNLFLYNDSLSGNLNSAPSTNPKNNTEIKSQLNTPLNLKAKLLNSTLTLAWGSNNNTGNYSYEVSVKSKYNNITKKYSNKILSTKLNIKRTSKDKITISVRTINSSSSSLGTTLQLLIP